MCRSSLITAVIYEQQGFLKTRSFICKIYKNKTRKKLHGIIESNVSPIIIDHLCTARQELIIKTKTNVNTMKCFSQYIGTLVSFSEDTLCLCLPIFVKCLFSFLFDITVWVTLIVDFQSYLLLQFHCPVSLVPPQLKVLMNS